MQHHTIFAATIHDLGCNVEKWRPEAFVYSIDGTLEIENISPLPLVIPDFISATGGMFRCSPLRRSAPVEHLITSDVVIQETISGFDTPPTFESILVKTTGLFEAAFLHFPLLLAITFFDSSLPK